MIIGNGANTPLNANSGTLPNMSDALLNYFQPMIFTIFTKVVRAFQLVEQGTDINFQGVWQPFTDQQLKMVPEGQRKWEWFWLHAEPSLELTIDQVVKYLGVQYRVMSRKNYTLYGYIEYSLMNDYTGSGPTT